MTWLVGFWRSTVGAKVVMAVTGFVLFGFTLVHMAGNLQVFYAPAYINDYSKLLHSAPELLWVARLTLLGCVVLHMWSWLALRAKSAKARPVAYQTKQNRASTIASRSMVLSGPLLLVFIIVHLLNLTIGTLHPNFREQAGGVAPEAFHNLTTLLANPLWAGFYIVSMLALAGHLRHGVFSLACTLGLSGEKQRGLAQALATGFTALVIGGNILIATACLFGAVGFIH